MDRNDSHRAARFALLTQTGPDTLMGKLLRRFWHPVATSAHLKPGAARALRILSEDLTLYRGESGEAHLIGGACAHRCTALHTGWVQGDEVRCMYHGWRYDATGACTEMPAETHARPDTVRIPGYPVTEYHGLIFAYLGDGPTPPFDLPRKASLEEPGHDVTTREDVWDCNWLQQIENSLDSTHLTFCHRWPTPTRLGAEMGAAIPKLEYVETSAGIRQTAIRPTSVRVSNWTFPNNNNVLAAPPRPGDPWINMVGWSTPIDDENSLRIGLYRYPGGEIGERLRREGATITARTLDYVDVLFNEHRLPEMGAADMIMLQDYVAVRGQGRVHDRSRERLGASDAGIALLRRILFRELDLIEAGLPTKAWTPVTEPIEMQRMTPAGA